MDIIEKLSAMRDALDGTGQHHFADNAEVAIGELRKLRAETADIKPDLDTIRAWDARVGSITIEVDCDEQGDITDGFNVHDLIRWLSAHAPAAVWREFVKADLAGIVGFGNARLAIHAVGVYEAGEFDEYGETTRLFGFWLVPKRKPAQPTGMGSTVVSTDEEIFAAISWRRAELWAKAHRMREESVEAYKAAEAFTDRVNEAAGADVVNLW